MTKGKGSSFEREICKQLSLWWSGGKSDDIFWRTAGSGARAKVRSKTGLSTFGQYGDVQATDPIGQPLIDVCTIELKRGYSKSTFADIIEKPKNAAKQTYEKFIEQAIEDSRNANSRTWMLIVKRDRKQTMVFFPYFLYKKLRGVGAKPSHPWSILSLGKYGKIYSTPLESFLQSVKPTHFIKIKREMND